MCIWIYYFYYFLIVFISLQNAQEWNMFCAAEKILSERKGTIQKGLNKISVVCDDTAIRVSSLESYLKQGYIKSLFEE